MTMPRPEHPLPQFVRDHWMNLNGTWEFEIDPGQSGIDRKVYEQDHLSGSILVPFCPESDLSGVGYKDFMEMVWYRRTFTVPEAWAGEKIFVHFGAVDYLAHVYVNGKEVGTHRGGYSSFCFDITDLLQEGENVLMVCAEDHFRDGLQPCGKQSSKYYSHGCHYTRTTGIWQTVWLEARPAVHITQTKYYPDPENCKVDILATVLGHETLTAVAYYEGKEVGRASAIASGTTARVSIALSELHLWDLGQGRLYDLELTYGEDKVKSYFGMRSIRFDGKKFLLNGRSVFQRLVLDQGFYPDGIYTAPTDEALENDVKLSMEVGFNGARLHEKMFESRFLYHADRHGYMVWGEHANWGMKHHDPMALHYFLPEWTETLERDFNHPAIIGWCPFNETWDDNGTRQLPSLLEVVYKMTKLLDPTRPCIDTSGNFHVIGDIFDVHPYEQDPVKFAERYGKDAPNGGCHDCQEDRQHYDGKGPYFVSEFGGTFWSEERGDAWGYGNAPKDEAEFMYRFKGLTGVLLDNPNHFGFCYTQLTNVEQEQNGLYTYDRKPKFDPAVIRAILTRKAAIED